MNEIVINKAECRGCGYSQNGLCTRPKGGKGFCTLERAILRDAGLDPKQWKRSYANNEYLYIVHPEDTHCRRIIDKERRMICR